MGAQKILCSEIACEVSTYPEKCCGTCATPSFRRKARQGWAGLGEQRTPTNVGLCVHPTGRILLPWHVLGSPGSSDSHVPTLCAHDTTMCYLSPVSSRTPSSCVLRLIETSHLANLYTLFNPVSCPSDCLEALSCSPFIHTSWLLVSSALSRR